VKKSNRKGKTAGNVTGNQEQNKISTALIAPFNGLHFPDGIVPDENASPSARGVVAVLANAAKENEVEAVPGLRLLQASDVALTFPQLAKYPLAVSPKSGLFNGRLMNIADYCRLQTGKAWNAAHSAKIKEAEGLIVKPIPDGKEGKAIKDMLSKELDDKRQSFHADLKTIDAGLLTRGDFTVTKLSIRATRGGFSVNRTGRINTNANAETSLLRQQLDHTRQMLAKAEAMLPAKARKRLHARPDEAIDVATAPTAQSQAEQVQETVPTGTPVTA